MRIELLQGQTNVFRFPMERRAQATLELLYELAPDVREVLNVADAYDLGVPGIDLRDAVDAEMAEYILNNVIEERGERRRQVLIDLLQPSLNTAIEAARHVGDLRLSATEAQQRVVDAAKRGEWTGDLAAHAEVLLSKAAEALLAAHLKAEEALGAARAVGMAARGEMWVPRNAEADLAWLGEGHSA